MHLTNISSQVKAQIQKLKTINLCPNTIGQLMVELQCQPPTPTTASEETVERYLTERNKILEELTRRANIVSDYLN